MSKGKVRDACPQGGTLRMSRTQQAGLEKH